MQRALRATKILGWTLSARSWGLFRWFKPFITARRWLSLRWPQSPGSGKQFFSKQTTLEPRVLAESFPKGFASRLLPSPTAAWPGGEGYRHAHVPLRTAADKALGLRQASSHSCHSRPGAGRGPGITARRSQPPGLEEPSASTFPGNSASPAPDRPRTVSQGHSRRPYFKDVPL